MILKQTLTSSRLEGIKWLVDWFTEWYWLIDWLVEVAALLVRVIDQDGWLARWDCSIDWLNSLLRIIDWLVNRVADWDWLTVFTVASQLIDQLIHWSNSCLWYQSKSIFSVNWSIVCISNSIYSKLIILSANSCNCFLIEYHFAEVDLPNLWTEHNVQSLNACMYFCMHVCMYLSIHHSDT